jgi:hypothetical protein
MNSSIKKMNKLSVKILLSSIVFLSQLFNFNDRALSININNNYDDIDFNLEWRNRDYFYYTQNFLATIYSQNLWESKTTLWQQNLFANCLERAICQTENTKKTSLQHSQLHLLESLSAIELNGKNGDFSGQSNVPILAQVSFGDIYKDVYDYDIKIDRNKKNQSDSIRLLITQESLDFLKVEKKIDDFNNKSIGRFKFETKYSNSNLSSPSFKKLELAKTSKIKNQSDSLTSLSSSDRHLESLSTTLLKRNKHANNLEFNPVFNKIQKYQVKYSNEDRYNTQQSKWERAIAQQMMVKKQQLDMQHQQRKIQIEQKMKQMYNEQQKQSLGQPLAQQQQYQPQQYYY